ncbi:MAG: hypothetical protein HQL08_13695, partial [Nitrospirae bacterium]|nr:hypothetical protein [Nitrospirota bacterium]
RDKVLSISFSTLASTVRIEMERQGAVHFLLDTRFHSQDRIEVPFFTRISRGKKDIVFIYFMDIG